ncbi:hypothetical protein cce_1845 [Crocosphaera subtropica ATCC 51142]|uniref:Uncharacterized protein n=1 Tax=Crocosphaera subtropica (strain ATCC 51142 / BH68) TaxID=43989 RepID=B1WZP3_CROS5|nr:hypothetical protein cce_1845 [Crocosphaera subtropica ATCC 51142]
MEKYRLLNLLLRQIGNKTLPNLMNFFCRQGGVSCSLKFTQSAKTITR